MNRIKELREAQDISALQLAEMLGTTQSTIWRLETGERKLSEDWMRRIAKALGVRPTELLAAATLAEFEDEVEPYIPEVADLVKPLKRLKLFYYRVIANSVDRAGMPAGKIALFDMSDATVKARKTGDIVLVRIHAREDMRKGVMLIRQYVAPGLLLTNRPGMNTVFNETGESFEVTVKAVMVDGEPPALPT
jgi:transcriptional regulator with XRE-family HTH domain